MGLRYARLGYVDEGPEVAMTMIGRISFAKPRVSVYRTRYYYLLRSIGRGPLQDVESEVRQRVGEGRKPEWSMSITAPHRKYDGSADHFGRQILRSCLTW